MKSIDTYLCKEKKEVYKVCILPARFGLEIATKEAIDAANKQRDAINDYRRKQYESSAIKWPLRLAVVALFALTIYCWLSL